MTSAPVPRCWRLTFVLLVTSVLTPMTSFAQTAELRGVVTDQSSGVLPGVTVTIKNTNTGLERALITDADGIFRAPALQPGPYAVTTELPGFKTETRTTTLTVGQVADVRIVMAVGTLQESIEVTGTRELVQTSKSDLSGFVNSAQLEELPLLNRSFIALAELLPGGGPARAGDARFGIQTAFGGTNVRSMYSLQIDGGGMDHPIYGMAVVNLNQDTVQEFRVLRNQFDAEYSRAGTAVVNVLTRSGTNDFRGMFSYYGRDDALNAKNTFLKAKEPFDSSRFSGTFGGPVVKNKAHFFGGVERVKKNYQTIIALPASNPFASTYNGVYPRVDSETTVQTKVDYQFNPTNAAFVRYLYDDLGQDQTYVEAENYFNKVQDVSAQWSWTVSSSKLNTLFVEYLNQNTSRFQKVEGAQVARPSFTAGRSPNLPQSFPRERFSFNETFFWAASRHAIKIGSRMAYEILNYDADYYGSGVWLFNTDREFNRNDPTTWPVAYTTGSGPSTRTYKNWEMGFFVQDDWKVRDRLTLNLGFRYDFDTNLRSNGFMASLLADPQFAGLEKLVKSPRGNDLNQFQPRFGFAWDVAGAGRTVIRGGYGIYSVRNRPWFNIRGQVLAGQFTAEVTDPNLLRNYPDRQAVLGGRSVSDYVKTAGGRAMYLPGDNLNLPYVHNVSLGFAKVLFKDSSLEVDVIHSVQKDLQSGRDANLPAQGPLSRNPRPLPQFSFVTLIDAYTTTYYDALQTSFKTGFKSATFQASYTLAKSITHGTNDNASTNTDPWNTFGNNDNGLDENDRRHNFTLSTIVRLPYGIQAAAIVALRNGNPWEINAGVDLDGDGNRQDRPAGLVMNAGGTKSEANLAIINAFRASRRLLPIAMEQLTQGSGDRLLDLRLTKQFRLYNSHRLDVFLEAYNVLNAVNYNNPSGSLTSGSFAIRTSARDPRQIQWGARYSF